MTDKKNLSIQDEDRTPDSEDSEVVKNHMTLQNQSSVKPSQYPKADRDAQSLVRPNKNKKD